MIPSNINEFGVYDQYAKYYSHYKAKYGKVAVMYQHGAHYNFFGTEEFGNVKEISRDVTLRLTYTDKNKSDRGSKSNPMMAGFPVTARSDYIEKLIMNGYVVVEVKENKAKKKSSDRLIPREVVGIYTPGTYVDEFSDENNVVFLYVKGHKGDYSPMSIGMCCIDVNTGSMDYDEVYNTPDDEGYAIDEIYRYIQAHTPKEILVEYVDTDFRLEDTCYDFKNYSIPPEIKTDTARLAFLEKVFTGRGISDVIDYLDLESKMYVTISLCCLLYYVFEHNKTLVENLQRPKLWYSEKYLHLANNAIEQLDIVNSRTGKHESIVKLVDFTSTSMGRRLLKTRLTNPVRNIETIEERYNWVELFQDWKAYEQHLSGMIDLSREHRKVEWRTITPLELSFLLDTYRSVIKLFDMCPDGFITKPKSKKYMKWMIETFDLRECKKYDNVDNITGNIFSEGYSKTLDRLGSTIEDCRREMDDIRVTFMKRIGGRANPHLEKDDQQGYYIRLTPKQYTVCKAWGDVYKLTTRAKNHVWATTSRLQKLSDLLIETEIEISQKIKDYYTDFLRSLDEYRKTYIYIAKTVSEIDVYKSSAKCAEKYKYSRPKTVENDTGYLSCKGLRHPLVERRCMYVPHDIKIGNEQGILVYGLNAGGKTTMMKALGTNLVLAQAGMFVAADRFKYTPYESIQTRILGNDNIFRGLSSFAVEMSELRGIISRAKNKSFVFGDEICHGTETVSGLAIVAASVIELMNKGANFVFASHLHELSRLDEIKKLDRLGVYHVKVEREGRKLIYKRTLEPGPGDSLYGLEVARAMNLPDAFIEMANNIRRKIVDEEVLGRKSKYNASMYMDTCGVCGEKAEHVHHIKFQKDADEKGFIDHYHKNNLRNLVGLCEKCHRKVHKGKITIEGYEDTSEGIILKYK